MQKRQAEDEKIERIEENWSEQRKKEHRDKNKFENKFDADESRVPAHSPGTIGSLIGMQARAAQAQAASDNIVRRSLFDCHYWLFSIIVSWYLVAVWVRVLW